MVSFSCSLLDPFTCISWPWEKETGPHIAHWIRAFIVFWRILSQHCKVIPSWLCTWAFKMPFHCSIKPAASGCWKNFCEVSSLIRGNALWKSMVVDKESPKSMDGSFGRSSASREGRLICRISVPARTMALAVTEVVQCEKKNKNQKRGRSSQEVGTHLDSVFTSAVGRLYTQQ